MLIPTNHLKIESETSQSPARWAPTASGSTSFQANTGLFISVLVVEFISSALFLAPRRKPQTYPHINVTVHLPLIVNEYVYRVPIDTFQTEPDSSQYFSRPSHVSNSVSPYVKRGLSLTSPFPKYTIKYILTSRRTCIIQRYCLAISADSIIGTDASD